MNKMTTILLLVPLNLFAQENVITQELELKPMIEGNRRVDEVVEWNKDHPGVMPPLTKQEEYEIFGKSGYPMPGTGAQVVERNSIHYTEKQQKFLATYSKAQKTNGFYERYNKQAIKLLNMPQLAEKEFQSNKSTALQAQDTHLRESLPDLSMNYHYIGIPRQLATKVIGYAPEHTFNGSGWNGAVEFFESNFGAVCAYHEVNIELTKSSAFIPKDIVTYAVNNKITTSSVSGNKDSGYVYNVEWWDKKFKRTLECAKKEYNPETTHGVVDLAKKIDSQ